MTLAAIRSRLPSAGRLFPRLPGSVRRHRLITAWMRLTGEPSVQLVRIRDLAVGYTDLGDDVRRLVIIEDDYEPDFFRIADALLASGGVFLDVGANYGLLTFGLAARHQEQVAYHLFEPNEALIASIRRSLELFPRIRCEVNDVALAAADGPVRFLVDPDHCGESHISEHGNRIVAATTVDSYVARTGIDQIALMKIDVEGHELSVLRGAADALRANRIHAVYFEYCEKWLASAAALPGLQISRVVRVSGLFVPCRGYWSTRRRVTHAASGVAWAWLAAAAD